MSSNRERNFTITEGFVERLVSYTTCKQKLKVICTYTSTHTVCVYVFIQYLSGRTVRSSAERSGLNIEDNCS